MAFNATFNTISVISVAVSFIGGGNRSTRKHTQYGNECYDCRRGNEKAAEQMMVPQQAIRFKTLKITCICLNSCGVRSPIHNLSMQRKTSGKATPASIYMLKFSCSSF